MHVVVFTRSSFSRALASIPICCSILQYTKKAMPSAGTWAIDRALFSLRVLVSKGMRTSRWWCVSCGNMKFICDIFLPGTACLYSGPSLVDLLIACLRNHLMRACRYWHCGCHPQDTAVGRDITHYSFSSIRAVVYGFSIRSNYYKTKKRQLWDRGFHRNSSLQAASNTSILYEAKQGCGVVSCTTSSYWGACWSKVLVLIWYHMYLREDCYFWFFIEILFFIFLVSNWYWYLVVGSRYDFFFGFNNMRRNTCRSDYVRYQAKT